MRLDPFHLPAEPTRPRLRLLPGLPALPSGSRAAAQLASRLAPRSLPPISTLAVLCGLVTLLSLVAPV